MADYLICPVCNNPALATGARVTECTPDFCDYCGYIQSSMYIKDDYTFDFFSKCWELQVVTWLDM